MLRASGSYFEYFCEQHQRTPSLCAYKAHPSPVIHEHLYAIVL